MTEENKIQLFRSGVLSRVRKLSATVVNSSSPNPDGDVDLNYLLKVLREHYRTVLTSGISVMLLALLASLFMTPVYRSQATIEIKEATPDIESLDQLQNRSAAPNNVVVTEVETEIGILKSDTLARQVINQVLLAKSGDEGSSGIFSSIWHGFVRWYVGPDSDASSGQGASSSLQAASAAADAASVGASVASEMDPKAYQRMVDRFEASLKVSRVGSSRLVTITYEGSDPRIVSRVVNAVVANYLQLHENATEKFTRMLSKQVLEAKNELEQSEQKMTHYAKQNGLLYLETNTGTTQNIVSERLRQLQDQLTQAQSDRYQKESVYNLVQKGDYSSLPGVFDDKLLQTLTEKVADLKTQYAQLSATFTDSYPKVKEVKNQLKAAEQTLARERQRAAASITNDYLAAVRREALLARAFQGQRNEAVSVADRSTQYNILKRNADSDTALYENILQKVKEASLVARIKSNNVNVVDRAMPQFLPVKPRIIFNLALGLTLGLGLGVGIAFLRTHFDTTLKTVEEVDRFLGLPALAMIPAVDSLAQLVVEGNHNNGHGLLLPDVLDTSQMSKAETPWYRIDKQVQQKYSPLVEAFRTLGSSVMLEAAGRKRVLRSIVVTSSQPGEGKTTVSVNLAIALAQQGSRVILVDADLRRPAVHRALGFRNVRGLSGYLEGLCEWAPCVLPGLSPGLDTLSAGHAAKNPVALLSSTRMRILVSEMLEEYDYLIIDSPALMPNLMDARILAGMVDGALMVVRSGMAPRDYVIRARKQLNNIVGVVLNSMDVRSMEDYYGYDSYGYGNAGKETEEDSERTPYEKRIAG
ncbi:MAG: polysaccharide biosynthesis tyrosine autokinase [Acidobacteria bacterium]|nr:MAG: polysaccharide biosynthesis tyrosine autokinase [Acidobacteriota bacterium]